MLLVGGAAAAAAGGAGRLLRRPGSGGRGARSSSRLLPAGRRRAGQLQPDLRHPPDLLVALHRCAHAHRARSVMILLKLISLSSSCMHADRRERNT